MPKTRDKIIEHAKQEAHEEAKKIRVEKTKNVSKCKKKICFPERCLAGSNELFDKKEELYKNLFIICRPEFSKIGM